MKAVEQLIGNTQAYSEFWIGKVFSTVPNGDFMRVIMVLSTRERYIALNGTWFRQDIMEELGTVHDCWRAIMKENWEIEKLGRVSMKIIVDAEEN